MQLTNRFQIKSEHRIIDFLNSQPVGRICSIDIDGFPQVIPMNFVFVKTQHEMQMNKQFTTINLDAIYMHSKILKEIQKLDLKWISMSAFCLRIIFIQQMHHKQILSILVL